MNDHLTAVNGTRERVETAGTSKRYAVRVIRLIDALKESSSSVCSVHVPTCFRMTLLLYDGVCGALWYFVICKIPYCRFAGAARTSEMLLRVS